MLQIQPVTPGHTNVGSGGRSPRSGGTARAGSAGTTGAVRRSGAKTTTAVSSRRGGGGQGMWRFYTDDSPGIKVGPVPVLVMSLVFIASVFMLHIWGKYTRA